VKLNAGKVEAEGETKYRMYFFIEQMSRSFPKGASFLCDKCAVLRATMNQPSYFDVYTVNVVPFIFRSKKCTHTHTHIYIYILKYSEIKKDGLNFVSLYFKTRIVTNML